MRSFHFLYYNSFPSKASFETSPQTELEYTELSTRFDSRHDLDIEGFVRYHVTHTTRLKFRGIPYSHKKPLDEVSERHRFEAYHQPGQKYLALSYGRGVCKEAMSRLKQSFPEHGWYQLQVDLKKLITKFQFSWGSYFRDIQVPHLNSSSLFGPHVNEGEFFKVMESVGKLSAIMTVFDHKDEQHKIMIASDGALLFYQAQTEEVVLPMITRLKQDFLDEVSVRQESEEDEQGQHGEDEAPPMDDLFGQ